MEQSMSPAAITLPRRSLIALCGPAGAGKSTFATEVVRHNRLAPTVHVSSDTCRLLLCDETTSLTAEQWAILQPNTFQLFLTIIGMRLSIGRPAIADGVNLHPELRTGLLTHARTHTFTSALIVFDFALDTCLAQNAQRDRHMPEWQIRAQHETLHDLMPRLPDEGWDHIVVLSDNQRTLPINLVD
jgi:predicted kinase